jgi:hypothetical protein
VYLPQDELALAGLSDDDIFAGKVTDKWRNFMKSQIKRARMFFDEAEKGVTELNEQSRWPVRNSNIYHIIQNLLPLKLQDQTLTIEMTSHMRLISICNAKGCYGCCRCGRLCYYIDRYWTKLKLMITIISLRGLMWAKPRSYFLYLLHMLGLWFLQQESYLMHRSFSY